MLRYLQSIAPVHRVRIFASDEGRRLCWEDCVSGRFAVSARVLVSVEALAWWRRYGRGMPRPCRGQIFQFDQPILRRTLRTVECVAADLSPTCDRPDLPALLGNPNGVFLNPMVGSVKIAMIVALARGSSKGRWPAQHLEKIARQKTKYLCGLTSPCKRFRRQDNRASPPPHPYPSLVFTLLQMGDAEVGQAHGVVIRSN